MFKKTIKLLQELKDDFVALTLPKQQIKCKSSEQFKIIRIKKARKHDYNQW